MNLDAYLRLKRVKAIFYFIVFVLIGYSIYGETGEGNLSSVAVYINSVYPIALFSIIFVLSGFVNLYIGWKDIDWHVFGFIVLYVYTIAVILAFSGNNVPFIAIPVYVGLSASTGFDVAMDVFVLPTRKGRSR